MIRKNKIVICGYISWIVCMIIFICFYQQDMKAIENSNTRFVQLPQIENIELNLVQKIKTQILKQETNAKEAEPVCFYPLSDYERWLVESIVAGESGIEPYWGKVGVASCILNACLLENKRPEEIQTMYGYAGWEPIEEFESECLTAYGNTKLSDEVREAVNQVFDKGEILNNEILWFYAPKYSNGSWHNTQKFVIEISNHRFYAPLD